MWFLGQNGFLLKDSTSPLIGIDLYLSDSCAAKFAHLPFRLNRQLPVFIEPQDLDIDIFMTTHSHQDHADPETICAAGKSGRTIFAGPYNSMRIFKECGVSDSACRLLHPGERLTFSETVLQATFALPTNRTDVNHTGMLISFPSGITFFNTGDTAWAERLPSLLPTDMDICAICINGGFHNLMPTQAAAIVKAIKPRVVIPRHYDMMVNNVGSPEMLRVALDLLGSKTTVHMMKYYEPWLYQRAAQGTDLDHSLGIR